MTNKWLDFFQDTWLGYKVSYDEHLKKAAHELYWMFEDAGLLTPNHLDNSVNKLPYRRAFVHGENWKQMSGRIPNRIYQYFQESIIEYLGIDGNCTQLKVEELKHVDDYSIDQHHKSVRVHGLKPINTKARPNADYSFNTSLWHTDTSLPLNNMVMMIYVDDVEEGMGEFVVADPVRRLYDVVEPEGHHLYAIKEYAMDGKTMLGTDEISSNHLTGPAGTVLGFNSHILHRANIPHRHRRRCIHLNIESNLPQHRAKGYATDFGHKIEPETFNTLI